MYYFVYGTLKKNNHNSHIMGSSAFIDDGTTQESFYMWDIGFPYVFESPAYKGQLRMPIKGEVWWVPDGKVREDLNALEGVDYGYYRCATKTITTRDGTINCAMFITEPSFLPENVTTSRITQFEGECMHPNMYEWRD